MNRRIVIQKSIPVISIYPPLWIKVGNNIYFLNGNVGIGTTGPTQLLEIYGDVDGPVAGFIRNPNTGANAQVYLRMRSGTYEWYHIIKYSTGDQYNLFSGTLDKTVFSVTSTGNVLIPEGSVGIGTATPNSLLEIAGPIATKIVSKTGAYTITATDSTIICDATTVAFTITLPAVANTSGRIYTIKKIDSSANAITIDGNVSETIDDALTYSLSTQYKYVTIQSDGVEWWIIANN